MTAGIPLTGLGTGGQILREAGENAAMLARLAWDLPGILHRPIGAEEARARLRERLATREQRFLSLVDRAIYRHARSPYLKLLRHAGCELGDVRRLVAEEGVEGTLSILASRGVAVTFEELKGRRDAVRGSQRFRFSQRDFDNPLARPHFVVHTSGSGGAPDRIRYPLAFVTEWADGMALLFEAHGLTSPRHAYWWPVPVAWLLVCGALGQPVLGWFYPVHPLPAQVWWGARYLSALSGTAGFPFPGPQRRDLHETDDMVCWLAGQLRTGQPLVLWAAPSAAVRLASAATQAGRDLRGLTILTGGEPVTEARRRQIEASGAGVIAIYACAEAGGLSYSCGTPAAPDDVHVFLDRFAVTQQRRPSSAAGPDVDALLVTSLTPTAAKITFNTETGDSGRLVQRECDCLLGALGLRAHLSEIESFEKLTGEGVSFARSNLERILEVTLPQRFGGGSVDYQIVEEEAPDGGARLALNVSPSVGEIDASAVRAALLTELGRGSVVDRYQAGIWRAAQTIQVRREPPVSTRAGKVLPFQPLRSGHPERASRV